MLGLRTSAPALGPGEAERIARDQYGIAVVARVLSGERDCNFHLSSAAAPGVDAPGAAARHFVLKILDEQCDAGAADRLAAVLAHLKDSAPQLTVPRLLPTQHGGLLFRIQRDGSEYLGMLMDFLAGHHLEEAAHAPQLRHIGATLALTDQGLQGFFHPSLGRPIAWDLRQLPQLLQWVQYLDLPEARRAVAHVARALQERMPMLRSLRSQAIHGDCHPRNLLFDATGERICGILDFGDLSHAPLIFEPAIAMAEWLMQGLATPQNVGAIIEGFAQVQRVEAAEVDALFDLIAARHASTLLVHAWRTQHDLAGAEALAGSAKGAWHSLSELMTLRASLTAQWHRSAGTVSPPATDGGAVALTRRHRLLGAGAELFYETPLHIVRGEGVWLYDAAGRAYLDVYNNVPHVGHAHPAVVAAIARQASLLATHTRYLHRGVLDYAEELIQGLPSGLDTCLFVNSGSEANDVAWRIAKMATGNHGALIMDHAYHGITDAVGALTPGSREPTEPWVVALTPPPEGEQTPQPLMEAKVEAEAKAKAKAEADVRRALAILQKRGFKPAAWFIDSALTSSGIFDPAETWAPLLAGAVRAAGGLVVADEVQFGLGRSGSHFWSFQRRGLTPDIVTLGKPVGNGYPMGIVIASRDLIETFQRKFGFFSTFGGNAVAAAAGSAVLRVLREEQLMSNALSTGEYLRERLAHLASRHEGLGQRRGCGLLQGLVVGGADITAARDNTRRIVNVLAAEHGVLIGAEGPRADVLKMRPPMGFGRGHVDQLVAAIDAAVSSVQFR
jgi:4-aminobutyrate aminotransferase-like enzyme/Ser/Thr protein kinase RdoA (MazF antagonist)